VRCAAVFPSYLGVKAVRTAGIVLVVGNGLTPGSHGPQKRARATEDSRDATITTSLLRPPGGFPHGDLHPHHPRAPSPTPRPRRQRAHPRRPRPGPNAARALVHDEPLVGGFWFDRTKEYYAHRKGIDFDKYDYATRYEIELKPLPAFQDDSPEEYQAMKRS